MFDFIRINSDKEIDYDLKYKSKYKHKYTELLKYNRELENDNNRHYSVKHEPKILKRAYFDVNKIHIYKNQFEYEFLEYLFGKKFKKYDYLRYVRITLSIIFCSLIFFLIVCMLALFSLNSLFIIISDVIVFGILLIALFIIRKETNFFREKPKPKLELELTVSALNRFNIYNTNAINQLSAVLKNHLNEWNSILRTVTAFLSIIFSAILSIFIQNITTIIDSVKLGIINNEWWSWIFNKDWTSFDPSFLYISAFLLIALFILTGFLIFLCPYVYPFEEPYLFRNGMRLLEQEELYYFTNIKY